jgi:hypothetical protein
MLLLKLLHIPSHSPVTAKPLHIVLQASVTAETVTYRLTGLCYC